MNCDFSLCKAGNVEISGEDEGSLIDSVFAEHKSELKAKALTNKALSFGLDQPSMQTAYKAIIGYVLFTVCSVLLVVVFNFAQDEYSNTAQPVSGLKMFALAVTILLLACLGLSFGHLLIGQNFKETIYTKHLHYHSPHVPYAQLVLCFFSIFLILKFDSYVLYLFLAHLIIFLITTFGFFKCFDAFVYGRRSGGDNNVNSSFDMRSDTNFDVNFTQSKPNQTDPELNIFTINA
jgi:hypothetical protein